MSKRAFTVTVDFTIDLDDIKAGLVEDLQTDDPSVLQRAEANMDEFWQMTDMELTNIVMDDIVSAIEDEDIRITPVHFRRHDASV
jgi:hypothetical protein